MLSAGLGLLAVAATTSAPPAPGGGADLTVWWRTEGAEVVETKEPGASPSCSLMLRQGGNLAVLMWPQAGSPTLFVRHAGWNFGGLEQGVPATLDVGDSAAVALDAQSLGNWVRAPLRDGAADAISARGTFRLELSGAQSPSVDFRTDPARMAKVTLGWERCRRAIGAEG